MKISNDRKGDKHPLWKCGKTITSQGYYMILSHGHPRVNNNNYVRRSVLIVEKSLGRFIPKTSVVHHADEDKGNDYPSNLVLCENDNYHKLLHKRKRAYESCGHSSWLKCDICHRYDEPKNLYVDIKNSNKWHSACINEYHNILNKRGAQKVYRNSMKNKKKHSDTR
jgi:hypothetical protein